MQLGYQWILWRPKWAPLCLWLGLEARRLFNQGTREQMSECVHIATAAQNNCYLWLQLRPPVRGLCTGSAYPSHPSQCQQWSDRGTQGLEIRLGRKTGVVERHRVLESGLGRGDTQKELGVSSSLSPSPGANYTI